MPDHPWNIDHMHAVLTAEKLPERDARWSVALADPYSDAARNARRISDWCQNAELSRTDEQTAGLTATALGWFLTVSNRSLRDHATKALAVLFFHHASVIEPTLRRFATVDDDYVRERVFAAAYGTILHLRTKPRILLTAQKQPTKLSLNPSKYVAT